MDARSGVVCVSDIQQLRTLSKNRIETDDSMFIATWSLSETLISIRDSISPIIFDFTSFLIAYQDTFGEINNINFFAEWKNNHKTVTWHNWPIEHTPRVNYLAGRKAHKA